MHPQVLGIPFHPLCQPQYQKRKYSLRFFLLRLHCKNNNQMHALPIFANHPHMLYQDRILIFPYMGAQLVPIDHMGLIFWREFHLEFDMLHNYRSLYDKPFYYFYL